MWPTLSRRVTDAQRQYTACDGYDIPMFLSRNLFLNYFAYRIRMNVVYLRLLGVDCWNWQVTAYKAVRTLLGRPMQLLAVGSIDRFCRFECVGLQQLLELLLPVAPPPPPPISPNDFTDPARPRPLFHRLFTKSCACITIVMHALTKFVSILHKRGSHCGSPSSKKRA